MLSIKIISESISKESLLGALLTAFTLYIFLIAVIIAVIVLVIYLIAREGTSLRLSYKEFLVDSGDTGEIVGRLGEALRRRGANFYFEEENHIVLEGPIQWHIKALGEGSRRMASWIQVKTWVIIVGLIALIIHVVLAALFVIYLYMKYDSSRSMLRAAMEEVTRSSYIPI